MRLGEVDRNLRHIEDVVGQAAREHDPDMIFLPEVSTTPNIAHRAMRGCVRPVDGEPLALYRRLAREYGCIVGAGALTIRGRDARNTYFVCEPSGAVHLHDKDQPSMWENAYYGPGRDDGVMQTGRRADRLRQRLRVGAHAAPPRGCAAACGCWPAGCASRRSRSGRSRGAGSGSASTATMLDFARESPGRMARVLGVPAVHPSHVGDVVMETPMMPGVPWPTIMLGETLITDEAGTILDRLAYEDGEGWVCRRRALGRARSRSTRCRSASG